MPGLRLYWLGAPVVEMDGRGVELETRKATALLAYLSLEKRNFSRETLAALLWPEFDTQKALTNLRRTLWSLNHRLQPNWLEADPEMVGLRSGVSLWIDVEAFQSSLQEAKQKEGTLEGMSALLEAVNLYRGDFLEGFNLKDSPEFDDWQFFQREGFRQSYGEALASIAQGYEREQAWEEAIHYARRWVALDRLHEPAQRLLIWLYAQAGQKSAALRQYELTTQLLQDELGQKPEAATVKLFQQVQTGKLPARQVEVKATTSPLISPVPPASTEKVYRNLPYQATPFVGRQVELDQIGSLLADPNCRLLTILGPGGMGKTRLAIEAARQQVGHFAQGVCFVPLAALHAPEQIIQSIASQLEFSFIKQENQAQQLYNFLSEKEILLILDNFEHLQDGSPLLIEILERVPGVKILVTSRERLNQAGEWVFGLEGLVFPEAEAGENFASYSAIQLFLQRARQAVVGFELAPEERPVLIDLCKIVGGMPLGIELAAAWVRMLSLAEVVAELRSNLEALTNTSRQAPERHQSIQAVCDYSWNLLPKAEKAIFPKLSIFQGGFTRQAAQTVTSASLALLTSLLDRSLLRRTLSGRYSLHELLRQYGCEKLKQSPVDEERVKDAHSAFYLGLLAERSLEIHSRRQKETVAELVKELDNIRSAWDWAIERGQFENLDAAGQSLYYLFLIHKQTKEGEATFRRAADRLSETLASQAEPRRALDLILGRMLVYQAYFCSFSANANIYRQLTRQAQQIFQRWNDPYQEARGLVISYESYGLTPILKPVETKNQLLEAYQTLKSAGDRWLAAVCLLYVADLCYDHLGTMDEARKLGQESLALFQEIDDPEGIAQALTFLGNIAHWTSDLETGRQYYQAAMEIFEQIGYPNDLQRIYNDLGYVLRLMGYLHEAEQYHRKALVISRQFGDQEDISGSLDNLGLVAFDLGDYTEAVRCGEEALSLRRKLGYPMFICTSAENTGNAYRMLGQLVRAQALLEESLGIARQIYYNFGIARAGIRLGMLAATQGEVQQAAHYFGESLQIGIDIKHFMAFSSLIGLASLKAQMNDLATAITWLQVALRHPILVQTDRQLGENLLEDLREKTTSEIFRAACQRGDQLSDQTATSEAMAWVQSLG